MMGSVDVLNACRAFVSVADREARRHDLAWTALEPELARGYAIDVTSRCSPEIIDVLTTYLLELIDTTAGAATP